MIEDCVYPIHFVHITTNYNKLQQITLKLFLSYLSKKKLNRFLQIIIILQMVLGELGELCVTETGLDYLLVVVWFASYPDRSYVESKCNDITFFICV